MLTRILVFVKVFVDRSIGKLRENDGGVKIPGWELTGGS